MLSIEQGLPALAIIGWGTAAIIALYLNGLIKQMQSETKTTIVYLERRITAMKIEIDQKNREIDFLKRPQVSTRSGFMPIPISRPARVLGRSDAIQPGAITGDPIPSVDMPSTFDSGIDDSST